MKKDYLTIDQVSERLGVHPKTVRRYISGGRLAASKIAGAWRISNEALLTFLEMCGSNAPQAPVTDRDCSGISDEMGADDLIWLRSAVYYRYPDRDTAKLLVRSITDITIEQGCPGSNCTFGFEYLKDGRILLQLSGSAQYLNAVSQLLAECRNKTLEE